VPLCGLKETALVVLEFLPADVAGVGVDDEGMPLVSGHEHARDLAVGQPAGCAPPEAERSRVAGVVQQLQSSEVMERSPHELALLWSRSRSPWKQETVIGERLHRGARRAGAPEGRKEVPERVLHLGIGVDHDVVV
jgi:hypothetical protein